RSSPSASPPSSTPLPTTSTSSAWPVSRSPPQECRRGARMPRLRILQFLTCLDVGGTERHVATLARSLDPARFDVRVACLRAGGPLSEEVEAAGVPIDRYPISRLWGPATWAMQRRFAAALRRNRIDIVHAYGLYAIVFAVPVARLAGTRLVIAS